jgi:hypothetical protein
MPNDALFEVSGALQLIPAVAGGYHLYLLLQERIDRLPRALGGSWPQPVD